MHISLIFLSGGRGSRMQMATPKQYLPLGDKPVALHSFDLFLQTSEIKTHVVVAEYSEQEIFAKKGSILFATPGNRRQDSVANAAAKLPSDTTHVLVHDGARPFLSPIDLKKLLQAGKTADAAALAVPVTSTIRKVSASLLAKELVERRDLWEMQTPQILRVSFLKRGILLAKKKQITVTDDVAFAELAGAFVQIVPGSDRNRKITTKTDYEFASMLVQRGL